MYPSTTPQRCIEGANIKYSALQALALDGCEWSASCLGHYASGKEHFILIG